MRKLFTTILLQNRKRILQSCPFILIITWFLWPMGNTFPDSYSTLVFDEEGLLLRAYLTTDQQYRFPPYPETLPKKYVASLVVLEDKRFFTHVGIDPFALLHAAVTNVKQGQRIRGGSTIPMQVARLSKPKKRTYWNKLSECLIALKLSIHFSKKELLCMYSTHVPMGGNIVGIQAASYKYLGKPLADLTWAEAALFAVLPNSPSMLNLSNGRTLLIKKRNILLLRLLKKGFIDKQAADLACLEPIPDNSGNLPFEAPHFCNFIRKKMHSPAIQSTLNLSIQHTIEEAVSCHHLFLSNLAIANLAVIVAETQTGNIRAYIGSQNFSDTLHGGQVDGVQAFRSTGSLLKPFLVAKLLDTGPYTMYSKVQDVPTFYGTFVPQNASKKFHGLVSLEQALIQSLNVPAVRLLNSYGYHDFYDFLIESGFKGLFRSPEGYGLSLIVGGAEAQLWELTQLYLCLGNFGEWKPLLFKKEDSILIERRLTEKRLFSKGASWLVLNTISKLSRPGSEFYWQYFNNQVPVAWKTGTSYGQKDGWAIGLNKKWVIGVWVGNFSGEGNKSIGGAHTAAPLLFTLFNILARQDQDLWFEEPEYDLMDIVCCKESGLPAGPHCIETVSLKRPKCAYKTGICPYHRPYYIDINTGKSVCSLCWKGIDVKLENRFIVPASVREILNQSGYPVDVVPDHSRDCPLFNDRNRFELIYPLEGMKLFIPRDYDGKHQKIVLSAKHQDSYTHLFWYMNESLIGETISIHQLSIELNPGFHRLILQDEAGFIQEASFTAYKKDELSDQIYQKSQ